MSIDKTVVEGKRQDMINLVMLQIATRVLSDLDVEGLEERVSKAADDFYATQPKEVKTQEGVIATLEKAKEVLVDFVEMYKGE